MNRESDKGGSSAAGAWAGRQGEHRSSALTSYGGAPGHKPLRGGKFSSFVNGSVHEIAAEHAVYWAAFLMANVVCFLHNEYNVAGPV